MDPCTASSFRLRSAATSAADPECGAAENAQAASLSKRSSSSSSNIDAKATSCRSTSMSLPLSVAAAHASSMTSKEGGQPEVDCRYRPRWRILDA